MDADRRRWALDLCAVVFKHLQSHPPPEAVTHETVTIDLALLVEWINHMGPDSLRALNRNHDTLIGSIGLENWILRFVSFEPSTSEPLFAQPT